MPERKRRPVKCFYCGSAVRGNLKHIETLHMGDYWLYIWEHECGEKLYKREDYVSGKSTWYWEYER